MDAGIKGEKLANPREGANPFLSMTFSWTLPTFWKGHKRDLEIGDLFETLKEHRSDRLGDKLVRIWETELVKAEAKNRKPSLMRCLIKAFGVEFMLYGLLLIVFEIGMRILQPLALGRLIAFYSPDTTVTETEAYWYAGGVIMCSFLNVITMHPYMLGILHIGMKMRVACCSLIYRKALRLSKTALRQTTAGQVVNLLSNDVNRFDVAVIFLHNLWVGPVETAIVSYFLYLEVGLSAFIGVAILLAFVPLQVWLGKRTSVLRLKTALRTDERVRLMNEIIAGIQVIKMYTWEKPFAKLVSLARWNEIKQIRATSYIRGVLLSFIMFTTRISIFASLLAYVLFGNAITAQQVFVITSYYNILRQSMTVFFPQGISQSAEGLVSIKRLEKFMLYEETQINNEAATIKHENIKKSRQNGKDTELYTSLVNKKSEETNGVPKQTGVFITNATAKWTSEAQENTLQNLNLIVTPGKLTAVIGPVGAGKSSLLHAVLKELPLSNGNMVVNGTISYASQEPWLFAGSVRQNILFGLPMDKKRYKQTIEKCALERDFTLLPYGDKTIVGERGISLSGGQRARINLARAVYREADIYLLDDPLSAVDTHVGKHLFEDCIRTYLHDKTVILVTHQLQYLSDVDNIIILTNGSIAAEGNFNELKASGLNFAQLLQEEHNAEEEIDVIDKVVRNRQNSVQSVVSSIEESRIEEEDQTTTEEQRASGSVGGYVYKAYFANGGNCCALFTMFMLFIIAQISASGNDYFITYWVNLEERNMTSGFTTSIFSTTMEPIIEEESTWSMSRETCIYIYSAIAASVVLFSLLRAFVFFNICMRSSMNLHDGMFQSITRATMRFFNVNSSGRILNRFSKDMGAIDELLPSALIDCLQIGLSLIGIIAVVAVVNFYLLIPTVIIGVIFYFLRNFYLSTSRSVKRLEGTTRSPVFSHLNATIQGLTTIRAFSAEQILIKEFDNHQDLHSTAWYLFIGTSRAFGYWLDLICIIYIALVTLSFLVLGNETLGGNVGLAITQSIGLTGMFQWGMRQSTELENQMTSVERVLEYSNLEQEPALETLPDKKPQSNWPQHGKVEFRNLSLRYALTEPHVLKNLNFTITPKEKVGIVGRTGAGKSSLIAALFRLADLDGNIYIDEINTLNLGLHDLRSKISIIPQEPVLFSGTMRKNLDPFDEFSDEILWNALDEVELKEAVAELVAGLNSKMSEGGSNFSVGQRQLVCLARAIVRNNKILVLDEATANVDPQTDALIQHTIRQKFANCTVLTIAHRLHTVMDSDKVLVMDAGRMIEFDHPHLLLQNPDGVFTSMVKQTGKVMVDALTRAAEQSYHKTHAASSEDVRS